MPTGRIRENHYEPRNNLRKDIEVCLTDAGHLYDVKTAQLEIAERFIGTELPKRVKTRAGAVAGRIVMAKTLEPTIADAWIVVEAVPERLDLKKTIFGNLDRLAPKDAILASNKFDLGSYPLTNVRTLRRQPRTKNTDTFSNSGD